LQLQQIRGVLPRAVTSPSSRYPQLLWVLSVFSPNPAIRRARAMLNDARTRALFINLKPRH
jgi:hypothetical protein